MKNQLKKGKRRDNLRKDILDAAKKLFLRDGVNKTSMRKIAAEVGISATTIYLHYEDKADIIHSLHQEGFKILTEQFKTLQNVNDPFERLKALGRCYLAFAIENHDYYEIMFIMREPLIHIEQAQECGAEWEEGEAAFQSLLFTVEECQQQGHFKKYDTKTLALLIWSNMHGLCTLNNNGHLELLANKIGDEDMEISGILQSSFEMYTDILERI